MTRSFAHMPGIVVGLFAAACAGAAEPNDPQWTGFLNGGRCVTAAALPVEWSADSGTIAWQARLEGYGQSTPVVAGGRVFVTSASGQHKEKFHVAAFDLATGQRLWQHDFNNPTLVESTSYVSRAAPTPAADQNGIVVLGEGGVLAALDLEGAVRWQRDLVADYGVIDARHGLASSLEQTAELVFVWIERADDPYLMAADKTSGETVWKVPGLGATTWSTPRLVPVGDGAHLVCSAGEMVAGFDPDTGARLWQISELTGNTTCTPIPAGDGQFILGGSAGQADSSSGLVKIEEGPDGRFSARFAWRAEKASCSFGSPLVTGDRVWMVNRAGVLYQLALESGEQLQADRIEAGSVWATPLQADGKVYLFGQKGTTSVVSASDGRELAANALWNAPAASDSASPTGTSHVLYAAAVADPYLLLRRGDLLYALKDP